MGAYANLRSIGTDMMPYDFNPIWMIKNHVNFFAKDAKRARTRKRGI